MNASDLIAYASALAAMLVSFSIGYKIGVIRGETLGRDKQWMDDFFFKVNADKNRRDNLGRFSKTTK